MPAGPAVLRCGQVGTGAVTAALPGSAGMPTAAAVGETAAQIDAGAFAAVRRAAGTTSSLATIEAAALLRTVTIRAWPFTLSGQCLPGLAQTQGPAECRCNSLESLATGGTSRQPFGELVKSGGVHDILLLRMQDTRHLDAMAMELRCFWCLCILAARAIRGGHPRSYPQTYSFLGNKLIKQAS